MEHVFYQIAIIKCWCCAKSHKLGPRLTLLGPHKHALALMCFRSFYNKKLKHKAKRAIRARINFIDDINLIMNILEGHTPSSPGPALTIQLFPHFLSEFTIPVVKFSRKFGASLFVCAIRADSQQLSSKSARLSSKLAKLWTQLHR